MSDVTKSPTSTEFSVLVLISFHTKHRYSWISDANLAIGWWRLSKIPVKYCSWSVLVFACHVTILSWATTTPEFFLCCISNNKKTEWWFIDFICNIYLTKTFTWFYKTENIMKLLRNYSIETVKKYLDDGEIVCGVFVDLQKAFDTVNHEILLEKLKHYVIRSKQNDWFWSFLTNRKNMCLWRVSFLRQK